MKLSRREVVATLASAPLLHAAAQSHWMYVGTYTGPNSKGIYLYRFTDGKLEARDLAGEATNPSFLTIHPNRKFLYSVDEVANFEGKKAGAVRAFSIDSATGKLTLLNQMSAKTGGTCYVTVDKTGKNVLLTNYGGKSVLVMPLGNDGKLQEPSTFFELTGSSVHPQRQKQAYAHSINMSPDNRFAVVCDLGSDQVLTYAFNADKGTLSPAKSFKVKPGSGPRHFTFHPDGKHGYVINEMGSSVTAMSYNAKAGEFTEVETVSTLPADFKGENNCAEVQIHPSGNTLYGSNRGHDSIAVFAIDKSSGKLTSKQHVSTQGSIPRNFRIDPSGSFLVAANQKGDNLVVFAIDKANGTLTPTGEKASVSAPVCIKFL